MAQVPERLLSWLYSHLHDYHDHQRTYADAVRVLSTYPSLAKPSTDIYTYDNGAFALLLNFSGTLPATFRGTTYHFPIRIWLPHAYPQEPPMLYVTPGNDMVIKPGQHVGLDGRVYPPYLRDWMNMWDRASVAEFLDFLQQVFGKEPPVLSRAQQQQYQRQLGPPTPQQRQGPAPAPPQLPPKQILGSIASSGGADGTGRPPPLPPKPGDESPRPIRDVIRDGPPLPPLPPEAAETQTHISPPGMQSVNWQAHRAAVQIPTSPAIKSQDDRLRGRSAISQQSAQYQPYNTLHNQQRLNHERCPVSPMSPANGYSELPENRHATGREPQFQSPPLTMPHSSASQHRPPQPYDYRPMPYQFQQPQVQRSLQPKQPPPDLLSDPFEVALSGPPESALQAPPIPPNPEKENLLHAISETMAQQAQQKVNQNLSAIAPLQAQYGALVSAQERLEGEIRQLEQLEKILSSNEAILHRSIQECDRTIATAKSKKQPPIDEVLIAPTMVANQLWMLCAEEAACREVMYVLQKAVDRGRVSGDDFVRQMRGLGRECFLKMALARKCAKGMGLETRR